MNKKVAVKNSNPRHLKIKEKYDIII